MPAAGRSRSGKSVNLDRNELAAGLRDGLAALGLSIADPQVDALIDYLALLAKWNAVYNLTAIRDPQAMLVQHLLDSLAIVAPLEARAPHGRPAPYPCVVDVGSGGGLPGIVLAIVWPQASIHLVEPVGKKAAFLRQCAMELGLGGVRVHARRVEELTPWDLASPAGHEVAPAPDLILCRAFASLADFTRGIEALAGPSTIVAAMKGVHPEHELAELPASWQLAESLGLAVPKLDAERHLLVLRRSPPAP